MRRSGEQGGIFFRLLFVIVFVGCLLSLYVVRRPLLRLAADLWMLNDPPVQSDAIIVLGGDNYQGDRAFHAADLYRQGLAKYVVASGPFMRPYMSQAELTERDLESDGVPAANVVKFPSHIDDTRDEGEALAGLVAGRGWKRIIVVTSNYHARRTRFIFERVFPPGVTLHVSGARDSDFDPSRWWETRLGVKLFFHEVVGYAEAWWELRQKTPSSSAALVTVQLPLFGALP